MKTVSAFYLRGTPCLYHLFAELAGTYDLRLYWPADWEDCARWLIGASAYDPLRPRPLPVLPLGPMRDLSFHGPRLARKAVHDKAVIFTRPDHAALLPYFARQKKIYYAIDDYAQYRTDWLSGEKRLLAACDHVVAVSQALGKRLIERESSARARLSISPNAVPGAWIPEAPPQTSRDLPDGLRLQRPIAGVLGSISSRLRLDWLAEAVNAEPGLYWLFAGSVEQGELRDEHRPVLAWLEAHPRCRFLGRQSYEQLARLAACLDVAVLPYSEASVNPYGSSVRLYLHLPFAQPVVATPGCLAVEEYQPLVRMCRSAGEFVRVLRDLKERDFDDGLRRARWEAAQNHSWARRAEHFKTLIGM